MAVAVLDKHAIDAMLEGFFDAYNLHDIDGVLGHCTEDIRWEDPTAGVLHGKPAVRKALGHGVPGLSGYDLRQGRTRLLHVVRRDPRRKQLAPDGDDGRSAGSSRIWRNQRPRGYQRGVSLRAPGRVDLPPHDRVQHDRPGATDRCSPAAGELDGQDGRAAPADEGRPEEPLKLWARPGSGCAQSPSSRH